MDDYSSDIFSAASNGADSTYVRSNDQTARLHRLAEFYLKFSAAFQGQERPAAA